MNLGAVTQQPAERLSYSIDYADALTAGDNVSSATVSISPSGLTVNNVSVIDPRVRFWVSGGTSGVTYKVTLTINTADGRIFQDEISFKIKEI